MNFKGIAAGKHERNAGAREALGAAMRADPKLRLFWAAGYYDLTTPAYAARYTLDQAGVPAGQLTAAYFPGPHGVYEGAENLAFHADMVHAHPSTERRRWALVEIDDGDVASVSEILLSDGEEFAVTGIHHREAVGDYDEIEAGVRGGRARVGLVQKRDAVAVCGKFLPGLGKHIG